MIGTTRATALAALDKDERTDAVVLVGEIGGAMEENAAEYVAGMKKPVVAFVAGRASPPGKKMGHAGAIVTGNAGSYASKRSALEKAGVVVVDTPASFPPRCRAGSPGAKRAAARCKQVADRFSRKTQHRPRSFCRLAKLRQREDDCVRTPRTRRLKPQYAANMPLPRRMKRGNASKQHHLREGTTMAAVTDVNYALTPDQHARELRRAVVAATVGTTIEWYDFLLYSTMAGLVFGRLFFPNEDPLTATLNSFAIYFVGFVARPIGAFIFGHYGDRIGRKSTLIVTLLLMGISTFLVAFLPGYSVIGVWGAVLLTVLRLLQGIGVGGEWADPFSFRWNGRAQQ